LHDADRGVGVDPEFCSFIKPKLNAAGAEYNRSAALG
jgi:hypothetical protein